MNRRQLLIAGALLGSSRISFAQPARKAWRIGYLTPARKTSGEDMAQWFTTAIMRDPRLPKGQSVTFVVRGADDDASRLPRLAAELVNAKVDVIVAAGPAAIIAASKATRSIPIVMAFWGGDGLLESGIVASFARPGGNVTGIYMLASELDAKRLELLIAAVPRARRIAVLAPSTEWKEVPPSLRTVAQAAQVDIRLSAVPGADGYGRVFEALAKDRVDAVLVPSFPRFGIDFAEIVAAAAAHRMPAMYESGGVAREGGLIGYGPGFDELNGGVVRYLLLVMSGRRPADLAVEQPAKFELVINMKTADALGLTLPQSLLVRADELVR